MTSAQTARPTVIPAALTNGKFRSFSLTSGTICYRWSGKCRLSSLFQRSVKFLLQVGVALTYGNAQPGAEIGFVGHFIAHGRQLRIALQPFGHHGGIAKDRVNTTILQIQLRILVAVVRNGSDFRMFIGDEFLVGGAVLHAHFLPFSWSMLVNLPC